MILLNKWDQKKFKEVSDWQKRNILWNQGGHGGRWSKKQTDRLEQSRAGDKTRDASEIKAFSCWKKINEQSRKVSVFVEGGKF